jgi:hypothetical protein
LVLKIRYEFGIKIINHYIPLPVSLHTFYDFIARACFVPFYPLLLSSSSLRFFVRAYLVIRGRGGGQLEHRNEVEKRVAVSSQAKKEVRPRTIARATNCSTNVLHYVTTSYHSLVD